MAINQVQIWERFLTEIEYAIVDGELENDRQAIHAYLEGEKMSDFIVEKLSKSVGDKTVFKDISFIIHDLDRIGLIGVNGTGKTTLLDVLSGVSGFDGDVSPFSAKNDYQIGYLTQDPDFDDSKTVLDTVLSSDLKEIQLIREYELLMLNYSEDKQARLERLMAEMDSLQAWEIESQVKTVLSKLGDSGLIDSSWGIVRWSEKTGPVGASLTWQQRPLAFG